MLLFNRKVEILTESKYLLSNKNGVDIKFKYTTMDSTGIPICEVTISNLDRKARDLIKNEKASLSIGIGELYGELVFGDIKDIDLSEEPEISFKIISNGLKFNQTFSKYYDKNTREGYILRDICKFSLIKIEGTEPLDNFVRPNGISVSGNILSTISSIANNRGYGVTTRGEMIVLYKIATDKIEGLKDILLNPTSGLINCVKYKNEDSENQDYSKYDYIVKSLPIPGLAQGDLIKVEHDNFNGIVQIVDYVKKKKKNWNAEYYVKVVG